MKVKFQEVFFLPELKVHNIKFILNQQHKHIMSTKAIFINISVTLALLTFNIAHAADTTSHVKKEWFKSFSIRGYVQARYNRLLETNSKLKCEQCDRSWGENGGFFLRRARIIFSGDVHSRAYMYIQMDLANTISGTNNTHFLQIRDAYFDISADKKKEFRFRIGQSKVPYGFENLQSSQNRLTLDRVDALNSAVANERDLGVLFMWAPSKTRELFARLVNDGLKGSGDYGVVALGAYNGQTANKLELNDYPHAVARISYPYEFKNKQIIEAGIQGYQGHIVIEKNAKNKGELEYFERRAAASFIWYPQPFGIQTEYNIGEGPRFDNTDSITKNQKLEGFYIQAMYMAKIKSHTLIPFVKYQYYSGGKKHEIDARSYLVRDVEIGVEWQPFKNFEFTAMYTISNRTFEDYAKPINAQKGNLLRLQAQLNF